MGEQIGEIIFNGRTAAADTGACKNGTAAVRFRPAKRAGRRRGHGWAEAERLRRKGYMPLTTGTVQEPSNL